MLAPRHVFLLFFILLSALLGIFLTFPGLDLQVQSYFYTHETGFFLKDEWLAMLVYHLIPTMVKIFVSVTIICFAYNLIRKKNLLGIDRKVFIFLIGSLAIGPGLIVHTGFKEHWGRARPDAIREFGGQKTYTHFYQPTDQCEKNCSFVSGHVASAFFFVAPALLIRDRRKRRMAIAAAFLFGCFASYGRIIQGKHFLSDSLFAGWITWAVIWGMFALTKPNNSAKTIDKA